MVFFIADSLVIAQQVQIQVSGPVLLPVPALAWAEALA
jgi:hypothetical protein